jgi:tetratricopeptide (TPR) repeat protein
VTSARVALFALAVAAAARAASADPMQDAERLYRDGQAAFDLAHYDDALAAWQNSYDLSRAPALHYNLGQAYRLRAHVGDCGLARAQYQRFIELAGPSPQRDLAERYILELAPCAAAAADGATAHDTHDSAPTSPEGPPATVRRLHTRKVEAAILGVGGLAMLVTGAALGHHAATLSEEVTHACSMPAMPCTWSNEKMVDAAGRSDAAIGWTLDAVGVAGLISSAALYWFGVRDLEVQVAHVMTTHSSAESAVVSWGVPW